VASASWGWCEFDWDSASQGQADAAFKQMTTEGIDAFVASGDNGSASWCLNGQTSVSPYYEVWYPASDSYVTSVGGTALNLNSDNTYASESVWNDAAHWDGKSGDNFNAGGGGISDIFALPSYQHGPGVSNSYSTGKREEPDVAALASPFTGSPQAGYDMFIKGKWGQWGGTSAATPLTAAIVEECNEYAIHLGKSGNGFVNPALYNLAANTPSAPAFRPFHDLPAGAGDNDPGNPKSNPVLYPATTGYDQASGLGSLDAYNLARDLAPTPTASTATTLSSSPNPSTVGQAVTLSAHVTSSAGTPTGTVTF
jgi:kumamolisin